MKYSHSRNLSSRSYAHVFVFMRFEWAEREMHAEMLSSSLCRLWVSNGWESGAERRIWGHNEWELDS